MKKTILSLALLSAAATAAQAQSAISAGTISLGGSIGYSRHTDKEAYTVSGKSFSEETTRSTFSFSPSVGYFLADNLAIGLNLGYTSIRKPYTTETPAPTVVVNELDPTTIVQVGPYVQYYKMVSDQFGIVGTLGAGFQSSKDYKYNSKGISETKGSGFYAGLTPSIVFFPIPKFSIGASIGSLGYQKMDYDYPTNNGTTPDGYEQSSNDLGLNFGFDNLAFSGTFYFGR